MFPSKDYSSNRLRPGLLQAPDETELYLDQTTLEGGQLNPIGVTNIGRITNIITQQRLEYDFQFYQQGFDTNMRTLVFSDGKALFPMDCHVYLQPTTPPLDCAVQSLDAARLGDLRAFLAGARKGQYVVSEEVKAMPIIALTSPP